MNEPSANIKNEDYMVGDSIHDGDILMDVNVKQEPVEEESGGDVGYAMLDIYEPDIKSECERASRGRENDLTSAASSSSKCDKILLSKKEQGSQDVSDCKQTAKCDICMKTFSGADSLKHCLSHRESYNLNTHKCNICMRTFKHASHLNNHRRTHTGEKPFECNICKKTFSQISNLNKHKQIHTGEKPFECNICKKTFTLASALSRHKRIHTRKELFECNICRKAYFSQFGALKKHELTHTGEKPIEPTSSSICAQHFRQEDSYKSAKGKTLLSKTAIPEFVDEKTLQEKPNSRGKYVKVRLQNASKMEDKIPLMDIKVEPSIVGDQPTSDSEIMNQQRTVIADIIKSIMHSLDLLIKSDPDNIRSANVRDQIIVALSSYQDIIEEKQLRLTSYKQVNIFDNSNNLKEIHVVYNNDKDDNSECLPDDEVVSADDSQKDVDNCFEEYLLNTKNKNSSNLIGNNSDVSSIREVLWQLKDIGIVYKDDNSVIVPENDDDFYNDVAGSIEECFTNTKSSEENLIETNKEINIKRKVCKPVGEITSGSKPHDENIDIVYNDDKDDNCEDLSNNDSNDDGFYNGIAESIEKYLSALKNKPIEDEITQSKINKCRKRVIENLVIQKTNTIADVSEVENDVVYPKYSKENLGFESTVPRYVCDICDVTVISKHHLTVHKHLCKRRHYYYGNPLLEEYWDNITCPLCDMKGRHRENLARHYVTHKVKDIEAALASLKEKGLNPENPEGNMKLLNDFIQEFEYKEKVDGDELSLQSGNTIQVHTEGNICKKPSIDDYVKFNLKKIVYDVDINKELFCFPCDIMFQTKQDLEEHRKKINDTDAFVCNHCDKTFDIPTRLIHHAKTHTGLYNCNSLYLNFNPEENEGCPRQFDYKLHACKYCLAIFPQEVSLRAHLKFYKNNRTCTKKWTQETKVQNMIKGLKLNAEGRLQCEQCDKSFKYYLSYTEHLASHSETLKCFCECGKGFKTKARLKLHINVVHAKKFQTVCEECGISLTRFNLKRHMRVHSNLKPFKCSFCNNTFRSKADLASHTRTHTKEKPWKCKYCGMAFSEKRTYNTHVNVHEGKTPYKCTECSSAFVSKLKLNKHVAEHQDCHRNSTFSPSPLSHLRGVGSPSPHLPSPSVPRILRTKPRLP